MSDWSPPNHALPNPVHAPGMKMRTRFRKDWRRCHRWHYVSGRGDSGYVHSREELRNVAARFADLGAEVSFFRMKPKRWTP